MADDAWKAGTGQKISKLYAWVATEPDGGEGIVGHRFPGMGLVPLIGADRARVESYRPFAEQTVRLTGFAVRLKVFGEGTTVDSIDPAKAAAT